MTNIDEIYEFTTEEQSLTEKDWAAGSKEIMEFNELLLSFDSESASSNESKFKNISYSPQMHKMFDEPIVNAIDHAVRTFLTRSTAETVAKSTNIVKSIVVTFDVATGHVTIWNDGEGVPTGIHGTATQHYKKETRVPTLIFGRLFQGSNRRVNNDLPIGGTNGIGVKITNCLSNKFVLTTLNPGLKFEQTWEKMKSIEHDPIITTTKEKKTYTMLSFMPNYSHFGYSNEKLTESLPLICDILYTRCCLAAAFCRYALPHLSFTFNGSVIKHNLSSLSATIFPGATCIHVDIAGDVVNNVKNATKNNAKIAKEKKFGYEINIIIAPHKQHHISNINGIVVSDGPHFAKIIKQISEALKDKVTKELNNSTIKLPPNFVKNNVFLMINTQMIKPGWTGQRKDVLSVPAIKISDLVIPTKQINQIVKCLIDMATNATIDNVVKAPRAEEIDYEKYLPAKNMTKKNAINRRLIPIEGDSAMKQIQNGISGSVGFDNYGLMCLGGVIMNVMKQITEIDRDGYMVLRRTGKLDKDPFMKAFMLIVGLNYEYEYDPESPTYQKEIDTLVYRGIIVAVDQDLDGRGNILPILMAIFKSFWPKLLQQGFIEWFQTDIIRLFPKSGGKVLSFFTEYDFDQAVRSGKVDMRKYEEQYYKGLARNDARDTAFMFKNFFERLQKFGTDDRTDRLFQIYYGKDPQLRKDILSKPKQTLSDEVKKKQRETKWTSASDHLLEESHLFQIDNLERKLDHVIDGQNQASRKILHGAMRYFGKNGNKDVRVAQLAGAISESEAYHHGEASLNNSIKNRAFVACGGIQVVLFKPLGQYGTRSDGGESGSERYVHTALTEDVWRVLFNNDDYYLLEFNVEDNKRIEPSYFVPIVPLAILESKELPAHGWKLKLWARDINSVIDIIASIIRNPEMINKIGIIPPSRYAGTPYEWKGSFKSVRGTPYSFGKYERYNIANDRTLIRITELPLRVWTDNYVKWLKSKRLAKYSFIESIEDSRSTDTVLIDIIMKSLAPIEGCGDSIWTDDIEEFFCLRESMKSNINLMGMSDEVIEFNSYSEVLKMWFPVRRSFYEKRIERKIVILRIQIKVQEYIIKYIEANYTMRGMKRAEMDTFLTNAKYPRVTIKYVDNPEFTKTEDIESSAFSENGTFQYLLGISDSGKSEEELEKHRRNLVKLQAELSSIEKEKSTDSFAGASTWLRELKQLRTAIQEGGNTNWTFGDFTKYQY